jgi:hypothetical protein
MPIFISYSHQNKEFVDGLAVQLVRRNINVWLDRWELSIGDSIIERVQKAVDGSSALLVVLSKASVASEWCNKEINAGFLRELEEKRVVVMPVLLEDCDIPIFARGKLYADFRTSFDDGLRVVVEGISKVTNPNLARTKGPDFHTDWSVDWGDFDGLFGMTLTYVEQVADQPYTCLTIIDILTDEDSNNTYLDLSTRKSGDEARMHIVETIHSFVNSRADIRPLLSDEKMYRKSYLIKNSNGDGTYLMRIVARRLGEDTGRDILINTSNLLRDTHKHMKEVLAESKPS